MSDNCVVILAGGQGKRMRTTLPKPMFKVLGEPMIEWVIRACNKASLNNICVVTGYSHECLEKYLEGRYPTAYQSERRGTGHAVMQAESYLNEHINGNTLVLCGDAPFIDEITIKDALKQHVEKSNSVTVITSTVDDPTGYGRIIRRNNGISAIVEEKDVSDEQRKIKEINSGAYWFKTEHLLASLKSIKPNNAQGELYLTDTVRIILDMGLHADAFISENPQAVLGANDRKGMLLLNTVARNIVITQLMDEGVEFICTDGITIGRDVEIDIGTTIFQNTIIEGHTKIGANCIIGPNTIIRNCTIEDNCTLNNVQAYESEIHENSTIGPFVHIRPNTVIDKCVRIGNFSEIKNSTIGSYTSVSHLTYVGDSDVGSEVNFGCGCATANFDGIAKSRTKIGDNAFLGCNTNLIAPVNIGNGVYTAAGSTVTEDIPDNALVIERSNLVIKENYAKNKFKQNQEK